MKGRRTLLTIIAIVSLATIGVVLSKGFLQNKPKEFQRNFQRNNIENVLGEQFTNDAQHFVQTTLENTLASTRETLSQKTAEIEQQILTQVQKEITTLSENQINALKTQICRDLGVLPSGSLTSSLTPTPR